MASWMVHFRIADNLLSKIRNLSEKEFIVGNIAPDSGVPNEDWTVYTPSTVISHFKSPKISGGKQIDIPAFVGRYFREDQRQRYDKREYSFYLGYLTHLLTDILWSNAIFTPSMERFFPDRNDPNRSQNVAKLKEDWYDLDFLYLRRHPDFHAFRVYENAVGFENTYMTEFAPDAFDNRRAYITSFYHEPNDHLDREYPYLSESEMDAFVEKSSDAILNRLQNEFDIFHQEPICL